MGLQLTDDELVLTLWAYRQIGPDASFSASDAHVQWLSRMLKTLPLHSPDQRPGDEEFRSADGLAKRVRQFRYIDQDRGNPPQSYLDVWEQYDRDWEALQEDAAEILTPVSAVLPSSTEAIERLDVEIRRRRDLWSALGDQAGYNGVASTQLEDLGIDRTQAGIYRDKERTQAFTADGNGLTVSVLPTGQRYADDLRDDHLIYHYPDTNGARTQDVGEIEATKNAGRYAVPIFAPLPSTYRNSGRDVRLGFVAGWDDERQVFLICFAGSEDQLYQRVAHYRTDPNIYDDGERPESAQLSLFIEDQEPSSRNERSDPLSLEIPHVSRPNQSRFYQECQRVIYNASAETAAIPPIHVQFDAEADGYAGDTWVQIQNQQEEAFLTDWKGSDPTRFPQGVKAAATALRDAGRLGQFRIWHQKGDLIILSDEHQHVSPERLIDSETSETDASPARDSSSHREGKQAAYQATRYERSAQARKDCIDHYGAECVVCGVDFGERYGELAEGFIHVHHLTPIAEVDEEYEIDPIEDLRPVCPNCHAVIHRRSPPLSISEVRSLLTLE